MKLNKEQILNKIKNGEMEIDYDSYSIVSHAYYGDVTRHDVKNEDGYNIEIAYPMFEELRNLIDEMNDEILNGMDEQCELYWNYMDEIGRYTEGEHNDVFDYGAEPIVYLNGEIL